MMIDTLSKSLEQDDMCQYVTAVVVMSSVGKGTECVEKQEDGYSRWLASFGPVFYNNNMK